MTWLGALNFLVLQWFGVRLARVMERRLRQQGPISIARVGQGFSVESKATPYVHVGWKLLRWVWPLTGWWSDYRWIARRS